MRLALIQRERKKSVPTAAEQALEKLEQARGALSEVLSFLDSQEGSDFTDELMAVLNKARPEPDENWKLFQYHLSSLVTSVASLANFALLLQITRSGVEIPKGRPRGLARFFVKELAIRWREMTGLRPARTWDPINDRESGDFYFFCRAAAETISPLVDVGNIDAAVRVVCDEHRHLD
jgi:hypothetical protein